MKVKILFLILAIFFFVLPFILWGNTYLVGGDDTRLYYIFPYQFLSHYAFNIISDNTLAGAMTGYASVGYFAPFFYLILVARLIPFLSTQMVLYGFNFTLGFIGFYLFLGLWMERKNTVILRIMGSIFYVSSIYLTKTMYTNQLIAMYLVSALPITLYLFIRGLHENKKSFITFSIAVFSLLSTTINSLPWWAAFLIASLPIFILLGFTYKLRFLKMISLGGLTFIILNAFWIFHFLNSYFFNTGLHSTLQYYSSSEFIKDNLRIIFGVATLYNPLNIIFQQMNTNILTGFSFLTLFGIIFFLPLLAVGFTLNLLKKEKILLFATIFCCFLLSWYFFSPGFGNIGPHIFLLLGMHVPFFTMFRNMYDKFSLSVSFYFAFSLTYSLFILKKKLSKKYFIPITTTISIFIVIFAAQSFYTLYSATKSYTHFSGEFNSDFINLAQFIKDQPDASKLLWLPLNSPTYANIEDNVNKGVFYSGLSPMRILADRSDFAGRFSFITQNNLFLGDYAFSLLQQKQYSKLLSLLRTFNIVYVVVDKQRLPQQIDTFMYGGEKKEIRDWQSEELINEITGEKLQDFGSRYTLYKINPNYLSEKIYLTDNYNFFPQKFNNVHYVRKNSASYNITIDHLDKEQKMVFLDPYYKDWTLYLVKSNKSYPFEEGSNTLVFNYANGWDINPETIKKYYSGYYTTNNDGSINLHLLLYFKPDRYGKFVNSISILGWLACVVILGWVTFPIMKRKNGKYKI